MASPPDALVTERKLGARTSPRTSGRKFQKSTLPNLIIASAFPRNVQRPMLGHKTAINPERGGARRPPRRPEPTGAARFYHIISYHVMSYHIVAPRCSVFPS